MNFLAHLYLAEDTPASMIGNLLPDLHRGPLPDGLNPAVLTGAANHRRVDAFTDTHRVFARSRGRIRPEFGIFSGILVDIFYDHVLARDWPGYHPQPLPGFVEQVHRALIENTGLMPASMARVVPHMTGQNWLESYATLEGIEDVLGRMSQRFAKRFDREVDLAPATALLARESAAFTDDFEAFFPELVRYVGSPRPHTPAPLHHQGNAR